MRSFYFTRLVIPIVMFFGIITSSKAQTVTTYSVVGTYTYTATGTSLAIDMAGAQGGNSSAGSVGGKGGRVQCTLNVTPGQTLTINVGGPGGNSGSPTGGANGSGGGAGGGNGNGNGGGGGGSSDIRIGGTALTNRVLVAAGGGGAGYNCAQTAPSENGGDGGGLTGGQGWQCGNQSNCTTGSPGTQSAAGNTGGNCTQISNGVQANGAGGTFTSYVGGGGGGYYGGGAGYYGGGGGGSSFIGGTGVVGATTTSAYRAGTGYVIITQLCTAPGAIVGSTPVCPGSTITLTNPTGAGGSWVSSDPTIATINSTTGVLTGVAPGTVTVTYLEPNPCGGVSATASVTVLPLPGPITGTLSACTGLTSSLSDGGTGTWNTSNAGVAAVSPSGVVTGVTAGTATISYTLSTGCAPATATFTVFPTPPAIGGSLSVCAGGATTTLTNGMTGGSWTSGTPANATITIGGGVVTGLVAGTSVMTYTSASGCTTTSTMTVNPLPAAIGGTTNVCVGATTTLTDATAGGTWTSGNTAQATINVGSGVATGVSAGTPTITYTLAGTGCRATTPLVVNAIPAAISGSSTLCVGATITYTDAGGGTWASSNLAAATVNTFTGAMTGIGAGTTSLVYTLGTGCSTSASVLVNPLPTPYSMTGGGSFCAGGNGVHVGLSFASSGVNYTLLRGGSAVSLATSGSNSGLDFGLQSTPGVYTVMGTNAITGCSNTMGSSVTVSINPLPAIHNVTGGGGYCAGTTGIAIGMDATDLGTNYQLYNGSLPAGPVVAGTGASLSFGSFTAVGTYTVTAINPTTTCTQSQGNSAVISVTASPSAYPMTGGGSFCAGGSGVHIGLLTSDAGTLYQLFHGITPVGTPVLSTGGALDFGLFTTAGTYTATGTNISGCAGNMAGSETIVINPNPSLNTVTGGGGYCAGGAGVHVGLNFSTPGISYSLIYNGSGTVSTVLGSGSGLDFGAQTVAGTYTVLAVNNTTFCNSNMTGSAVVSINTPPTAFNVHGSGSYCMGSGGRDVSTDGSEYGVNYQLYSGITPIGLPIAGTVSGSDIDFGFITAAGVYNVKGTNTTTGCNTWMTGNATITVNPLPGLHNVTGGGNYCLGGTAPHVGLNNSNTGIIYQLLLSGSIMSTVSGTGAPLDFGPQPTAGVYTVMAMDSITGCQKLMLGSATININALPLVDTVTGGGSYCAGGTGFHVGLGGSTSGILYQLYNGTATSGTAVSGSGSTVDFGVKTAAGVYTVVAINPLTGCTSPMSGSALINVNALPMVYPISGSGNYCLGGSGLNINMANSDPGINYQLFRYGVATGDPVQGAGGPIGLGLDTFGVYTAIGTDTTTGCSAHMAGTVTINTVSPVAYTVTGGGSYCPGGTGVLVNQSGSALGVSYQLISGGSPVGLPLSGTGSLLSFGLILTPGSYTVQATDTTLGCVATMAGSATVNISSLPVAEPVTGGGSFCAGVGGGEHVGLGNSISGVNYQLLNGGSPVGLPVSGITGSTLDFGLQTTAGTYTATAIDLTTGCTNLMAGTAVITIKPTPVAYPVTAENSGNYCAADSGVHISLANSETGVNYELFRGSTPLVSMPGTGAMLTLGLENIAGIYTVVGSNVASGCITNMTGSATVFIVPLPDAHTVTGGGGFCPGGSGVLVGIDGSNVGITYQLYNGTTPVGTSVYGTGSAMSFGLQNMPGVYTVIGNSAITPCANNMFGEADVHFDTVLTPVVTVRAFPGTGVGVSQVDSIKAYVTNGGANPTYQWYINGHPIAGATNALFVNQSFFNNDSVSCSVTASGPCGGATTTKSVVVKLLGVGVKNVNGAIADLKLLPNPNKGTFALKGNTGNTNTEELTVEVTNMLGQVVYSGKVTATAGNIDAQINLNTTPANGMYLLNVISATGHTAIHFVIEQ